MFKHPAIVFTSFILVGAFAASPLFAFPDFKKSFEKKYVKESKSEDLAAAFKAQSCNVCHVKGEKKTKRNRYGHELHEVLEDAVKPTGMGVKKLMKADKAKVLKLLDKAFDDLAKKKSKSGKTYGDIIKSGKLPSTGDPEEKKKDD